MESIKTGSMSTTPGSVSKSETEFTYKEVTSLVFGTKSFTLKHSSGKRIKVKPLKHRDRDNNLFKYIH